jgi:hypothetical protein
MDPALLAALVSLGLLFGMLACLEFGRRVGQRRMAADPEGVKSGTGPVDSAVFALLGLLIAFTFSSASNRYESRRQLLLEEANDIGTAWLRLDLVADAPRAELQALFREYLDSRLETYRRIGDPAETSAEYARTQEIQGRIWSQAVPAARAQATPAAQQLLLPALNAMFDIANSRQAATRMHQPPIVFAMLILVALCGAVLAGHSLATGRARSWMHTLAFAAVTAITLYVILDLEYPRFGLIRIDAADQLLLEVRASMK